MSRPGSVGWSRDLDYQLGLTDDEEYYGLEREPEPDDDDDEDAADG